VFKNTRGVAGQILGGWSFAPIFEARNGTPFTVFDCTNAFNTCPRYAPLNSGALPVTGNSDPPSAGIAEDPNVFNYMVLPPRLDYFSDLQGLSDFGLCTTPGQAATGCPFPATMTARNQFRGPNHWMWDMGVYKNFKLTERFGLQFRGELFNVLNHPNLFVIGSSADVSTGQIVQAKKGGLPGILLNSTNTREHRNVQLALKLIF
jgi:hypothetical protein